MSYHANIAAAENLIFEVMPRIWHKLPDVRLLIVGKDPPDHLTEQAKDSRIEVTGFVTDLRPYLAQATLSISPMRYGVGIQNKVLEAMAMQTPVICSPQAISALQVQVDQQVMVAETPQAMAETALTLLNEKALREEIGQGGRRYVETHHNWVVVTDKLSNVYREVIEEAKHRSF
jgi:glycosyltransferase involved in cell wall biosynthesis